MAPLTSLTLSKIEFNWTKDYDCAFDIVKFSLTHKPILTLSKLGEQFEVVSNVFLIRLGAILLQERRPMAFLSRKFSPIERNIPLERKI